MTVKLENPLGDNLEISDATSKFNLKFNKKAMLPMYVPFEISYSGASLDETHLTISYFNQKTNQIMIIHVFPSANDNLKGSVSTSEKEIKLTDGTKAVYYHYPNEVADRIHFIKDGLEYRIGLSKTSNKVSVSTLVMVADSLRK